MHESDWLREPSSQHQSEILPKEHFESDDHKRNEKKLKIKMKENFEKKCDNKDCLNINMDKNIPDNHFFFQVSDNISGKR